MREPIQNLHALNPPGFRAESISISAPWYRRREFLVFIIVFLLVSISGLVYCFSRAPVFRSSASLALHGDTESNRYWATPTDTASNQPPVSEHQHIAVQSRILTDPHLLQRVWGTIQKDAAIPSDSIRNFDTLRNMLSVVNLPNTSLVELRAEGSLPEILPILVELWIETYRSIRSANVGQSTSFTNAALTDQLETLKNEIDRKRRDIEAFRKSHGIMSEVRDENPALTKLTGLNQALNQANDEAVKTKSRLESVQESIARGEPVFLENSNNSESLAELEKSAQVLREQMAKLEQQYTPDYIQLVPDLKAIPEQLRAVEAKIATFGKIDQERVLSVARQDERAADQKARSLQQQLDEYKQTASEFTARFSVYQEQQVALRNLEEHYRATEDKILRTEVQQHQKYPDIEVVNKAFLPQQPIGPDYFRDAGITVAASLVLGLLGVWISNILVPKSVPTPPAITLTGIHLYPDANAAVLPAPLPAPQLSSAQPPLMSLAQPIPEELTEAELQTLWDSAPLKGRQLIGVLLTGITVDEAALLDTRHIELDRNRIEIPENHPRFVTMPAMLKALFNQSPTIPAWRIAPRTNAEDLRALLACLATDADLPGDRVTAESLRHTYLMYLVRQGIRLAELTEIAGYISPSVLAVYRSQSPRGPGKSLREIDPVHPLLRG